MAEDLPALEQVLDPIPRSSVLDQAVEAQLADLQARFDRHEPGRRVSPLDRSAAEREVALTARWVWDELDTIDDIRRDRDAFEAELGRRRKMGEPYDEAQTAAMQRRFSDLSEARAEEGEVLRLYGHRPAEVAPGPPWGRLTFLVSDFTPWARFLSSDSVPAERAGLLGEAGTALGFDGHAEGLNEPLLRRQVRAHLRNEELERAATRITTEAAVQMLRDWPAFVNGRLRPVLTSTVIDYQGEIEWIELRAALEASFPLELSDWRELGSLPHGAKRQRAWNAAYMRLCQAIHEVLRDRGLLRGPCPVCGRPAWVVRFRPPGRGRPPADWLRCPACAEAGRRASKAGRQRRWENRQRGDASGDLPPNT